jgi:tRNA (mo5U34)-methyltransferase
MGLDTDELRREIESNPLWYHSMELAPGIETPGWFDMRPVSQLLPWPDVQGKRCLDVGTYDGFLAFEMERRGAEEVVAIDIDDHTKWDWPPDVRAHGGENLAKLAGPEKGRGFRIAAAALDSKVDRRPISVYDLDPRTMGMFDVVVCGSLLLHLRDPLRALEAIRGVCSGYFLSAEEINLVTTVTHPHRPLLQLNGSGPLCQWMIPNAAGHRRMLFSAGFEIVHATRPYAIPFGPSHPRRGKGIREQLRAAFHKVAIKELGVPAAAALARPRV